MDEFIDKQVVESFHGWVTCKKAYEIYVHFQKVHLLKVVGKRAFNNSMVERGFLKQRGTNNKLVFKNIEIKPVFKRGL